MDRRGRRLTERVRAMVRDDNQLALQLFRIEHPQTWRLILNRLKQDEEAVIAAAAEKLADPKPDH